LQKAAEVLVVVVPLEVARAVIGQVPVLGPVAVALANRGLEAIRARREQRMLRTAEGWRAVAQNAIDALGETLGGADPEEAIARAWVADQAVRRITAADPGDASARETLAVLREVRERSARGEAVSSEVRGALDRWSLLSPGWMAAERRRVEIEWDVRAFERGVRPGIKAQSPLIIGEKPVEDRAGENEEDRRELEQG
jgi:hypothetical protein